MTIAATLIFIILMIPFVAMQFTKEVNWTTIDFIVAGAILTITALLIELSIQLVKKVRLRGWLIATVLLLTIYIWLELAVGVIS